MHDTSSPRGARSRFVGGSGPRLHYLDWGGPKSLPAIALHGFALNGHSWDEVAPALIQRVHLHAFDQRGHGLSERAPRLEDYSREHMVADIERIISELSLDCPVLIGHSMGGLNAMAFAARHPDRARALILVDVGPEVRVDGASEVARFVAGPYELDSLDAWVEHTHRYYPWRTKDRIRERLKMSLRRTPEGRLAKQYDPRFREGFGGVIEGQQDLWELAHALRCPTLLVHGAESPVLTREMAERFVSEVEKAERVTIPGASHSVAGDQPEAFARAVLQFLDKRVPG